MDALFQIVKNELQKHNVGNYHTDVKLITVPASTEVVLDTNNDFYFFVNAFANSGVADGRISGSGGGNALDINSLNLNTLIFKYQMFKGKLKVVNNDNSNTLYVEILRVTPIPEIETI